ncbi:MAG TPA: hypothetical protein VNT56_02885 [Acidimicrobiales bacterium]|jgi:hypothetical protein|nr:hypothetical protein [Acidimicrobiales bacterium]
MADDPNRSELLDEDKLTGEYPPDRPLGVDDTDLEGSGHGDESLAERVAREEPDRPDLAERAEEPIGPLVSPDAEVGRDTTKDEVATVAGPDEQDLAEPASERGAELAAEEAAVHRTDDPPLGGDDDYV